QGCTTLLARPDRHGRFHHQDLAPARPRQIVERGPDVCDVRIPGIRRRCLYADEDRLRSGEFVGFEGVVDAIAVALEDLRQIRLVERQLAGSQRVDALRNDVPDDHLVTELGEAPAGDEPYPPGA